MTHQQKRHKINVTSTEGKKLKGKIFRLFVIWWGIKIFPYIFLPICLHMCVFLLSLIPSQNWFRFLLFHLKLHIPRPDKQRMCVMIGLVSILFQPPTNQPQIWQIVGCPFGNFLRNCSLQDSTGISLQWQKYASVDFKKLYFIRLIQGPRTVSF